uniref:Uncharacterized protein n=1 Tax=Amphilophus citrinellus TaxID=61819 RepID=A0A3Q0SNB4_AMPCI
MANFEAYQEYQRIDDFEEDSPPGEEDLLLHVPEGLKAVKHCCLYLNRSGFIVIFSCVFTFIKYETIFFFFFNLTLTVSFCLLSHSQRSLSTAWNMMSCLPIERSTTQGQSRTLWTGTKSHCQMPSYQVSSALRGNNV